MIFVNFVYKGKKTLQYQFVTGLLNLRLIIMTIIPIFHLSFNLENSHFNQFLLLVCSCIFIYLIYYLKYNKNSTLNDKKKSIMSFTVGVFAGLGLVNGTSDE